ncbi:hypothetical protein GYA13_03680 [Candidatus Kuenenbacteria bacterium]|nr:hypothetical protein [Candidatus Kuenenbacteria bacterium]
MAKISKENKIIINNTINAEWFFLTKRPDIPPLPVWYKMKLSALSKENKKIYGVGIPWACFWYENTTELYLHDKEYRLAIKRATKMLYSEQDFRKHLLKLKRACRNARKAAEILDTKNLRNFNNKQLLKIYTSAVDKYVLSYVYGFITWCTPVLQHDAKSIIGHYEGKLKKINTSPDQALGILIVPDDLTIYQEKEEALTKLSKKYKHVLNRYKSEGFVSANYPKLYKEIERFINKYCWVGFNYIGPKLDYKVVVNELLQARDKIRSEQPTKDDIHKACKFNDKEKHIFYALRMISYTKDLRNVTDDYVNYCFGNFYNEVSKRVGLTKKEIHFLWDDELNELIKGENRITSKYIQNKRKFCAAIAAPKSVGLKQYYIGVEARDYRERVFKNSNQLSNNSSQSAIKGTIASTGVTTGRVKIIHSASEVGKVKKGDILVVGMTSPKYMSAILNAGAIITDDGGLTCHAAIITRELRKPCIIGTKIATSILKDGDLVEVDANKGIIKILKRKKIN